MLFNKMRWYCQVIPKGPDNGVCCGVDITVWSQYEDFSAMGYITDQLDSLIEEWYPGKEKWFWRWQLSWSWFNRSHWSWHQWTWPCTKRGHMESARAIYGKETSSRSTISHIVGPLVRFWSNRCCSCSLPSQTMLHPSTLQRHHFCWEVQRKGASGSPDTRYPHDGPIRGSESWPKPVWV